MIAAVAESAEIALVTVTAGAVEVRETAEGTKAEHRLRFPDNSNSVIYSYLSELKR